MCRTKPCCSLAAALCPGCGPASSHWKGFLFVTHSHVRTHSPVVTDDASVQPPSHTRSKQSWHPFLHTYSSFSCPVACFSPPPVSSLPEEASPVKLHHWHSDHSTYFNSFQVTSSLLLNKWLNRRSPSAAWAPAYRASPHGRVTGIFFRLVTGEPRLETRMNHFGLSQAFCFVEVVRHCELMRPEKSRRTVFTLGLHEEVFVQICCMLDYYNDF